VSVNFEVSSIRSTKDMESPHLSAVAVSFARLSIVYPLLFGKLQLING
jgi:hypothetical protein